MKKTAKRYLFNFFGGLFLLIGIAGIVLPLLPTTPFLLLAGYFFSKGSQHFHHWLIHHKHLGPPLRDWEQKGVIRKNSKILATLMMMASALFIFPTSHIPMIGKGGFALTCTLVLIFIWTRPSR